VDGARKSVLVVDDDAGLVQVIALTLRSEGFEVFTARDGVQGYIRYLRSPTDWVVTDIQMPKLDGLGMMRCIRAINTNVRILYMSGAVDQFRAGLESEAAQFGASVLPKPFSRNDLICVLTGDCELGRGTGYIANNMNKNRGCRHGL